MFPSFFMIYILLETPDFSLFFDVYFTLYYLVISIMYYIKYIKSLIYFFFFLLSLLSSHFQNKRKQPRLLGANGSAFDSRSKGWAFESLRGQLEKASWSSNTNFLFWFLFKKLFFFLFILFLVPGCCCRRIIVFLLLTDRKNEETRNINLIINYCSQR